MPRKKRLDIKGKRFGRLTVVEASKDAVDSSGYISPMWLCLCDCGKSKIIRQSKLLSGNTKSCGCYRREYAKNRAKTLNLIEDAKQYILDRIRKDIKTGCWEWTGTYFTNGYARAGLTGRAGICYPAHASRMSFLIFKGEITKGLCVCHTCDNPKCVNPDHLFLGTHKDNAEDMVKKNRSLKGERHNKAKLTEKNVRAILLRKKEPVAHLASMYDVSICTINDILCRRTWKHVQE